MISARETREKLTPSRENDYFEMGISRSIIADIERTIRFWKRQSISYRLSRRTQQSIQYLISYTMSKTVKFDENLKNYNFRVDLAQRILYV